MRFLFVNRIHEIDGNKIRGNVNFAAMEPWRREGAKGALQISNSVVSEAIGQLVSWLSLRNNDFTARPVFLFASQINLDGYIPAPSVVELEAWITNGDENSFIFSGTAKVDGKVVVEITDCGGYFMPLAELEDPAVTRQRFSALTADGVAANPAGPMYSTRQLIDEVKELQGGHSISAVKTMRLGEPFYADHFPRNPVTPIVVINEMIAEATRRMMEGQGSPPLATNKTLSSMNSAVIEMVPVAVRDLKIKSFIVPGDTVIILVKKVEVLGNEFETIAEIMVNQKKILRGRYRYRFVELSLYAETPRQSINHYNL
jgi:3-hydroxymyristoyl/3-hydroxydecanoyl-(acyl carrier protein) dehydratase